jgi:hypothetical protein
MGNCLTFIGTTINKGDMLEVDATELQSMLEIIEKYRRDERENVECIKNYIPSEVSKYVWTNGKYIATTSKNDSPIRDLLDSEDVESVKLSRRSSEIYTDLCNVQKECIRISQEIVFNFE